MDVNLKGEKYTKILKIIAQMDAKEGQGTAGYRAAYKALQREGVTFSSLFHQANNGVSTEEIIGVENELASLEKSNELYTAALDLSENDLLEKKKDIEIQERFSGNFFTSTALSTLSTGSFAYAAYTLSGGSPHMTALGFASIVAFSYYLDPKSKEMPFFGVSAVSLGVIYTLYGMGAAVAYSTGLDPDICKVGFMGPGANLLGGVAMEAFADSEYLNKKQKEKKEARVSPQKKALGHMTLASGVLVGLYQGYKYVDAHYIHPEHTPVKKQTTLNALPTELFLRSADDVAAHETARGKNTITWAQAQKLVA